MPASKDVCVVLGTRPEIIKLAPLILELGPRARVINSGQHYDQELSGAFYSRFGLPAPDCNLRAGAASTRSEQMATMLGALGRELEAAPPRVVIAQGDTNTVSAAAQAANYAGIPFVHVEAGLRSFDRSMPEEINRRVVGVLADVHCCPTETSAEHLLKEGTPPSAVVVTGNTIVESCAMSLSLSPGSPQAAVGLPQLRPGGYIVSTIHRPENTDEPRMLAAILGELQRLPLPVVFVPHPRTRHAIERNGLGALLEGLLVIAPPDHSTFLALARDAALCVSDSGGIQEECTVIKTPLVVVRRSTERPESFDAGFAQLAAPGPQIGRAVTAVIGDPAARRRLAIRPSPFGDGLATKRIASIALALADDRPFHASALAWQPMERTA